MFYPNVCYPIVLLRIFVSPVVPYFLNLPTSAFNDHFSSFGLKLFSAIKQNGDTPSYLDYAIRRPNIDSNSKPLTVQQVILYSPEEELHELVKTWWKTESFGCK